MQLTQRDIIKELKSGELEIRDVPEEFALDSKIVKVERKLGLRKSGHRGFDVITQEFFVEEDWPYKNLSGELVSELHNINFKSFEEYYRFLDGDIYENACYYQYAFEDDFSKSLQLDIDSLTKVKSFVTETIDDYLYERSLEEIEEYNYHEKVIKNSVKQWIDEFNTCDTYEQFKKVCSDYKNTTMAQFKNIDFFFYQYAYYHEHSEKQLDIIMEYMSKDHWRNNEVLGLCLVYTPGSYF